MARLAEIGGANAFGTLDCVFIDHDQNLDLPHPNGSSGVDGCSGDRWSSPTTSSFPVPPGYREHMSAREGKAWRTTKHETHAEYQPLIKDLVLESEYLGAG